MVALAHRTDIPPIFQLLIVLYVLLTGEIPRSIQAALFGLVGGGEAAFTAAFVTAILVDAVRLAPLFVLRRHPLGILHPLVIAILLWPMVVAIPSVVEQFGGLGGLFLGLPVSAPYFRGLGWQPSADIWLATAGFNILQLLGLISAYAGFALSKSHPRRFDLARTSFNSIDLRRLVVIIIALNFIGLLAFIQFRGGLDAHLAELARGRFRSLAGLGPLIVIFDIGIVGLILWMAARPGDVGTPLFLAALGSVVAAQFLSNGSRSGALMVFMVAALTWAVRTRQVPWRLAVVLAPLVFLSLGLLNIARTSAWTGQGATEAVASADASTVLTQVQEEIEIRRSLAGAVPIVADGFRITDGPLLGRTYLAAVFAMVPRSMWEDKPRGPGSLYAQYFLGEVREGVAVPIGATAEIYWNFALPGVIVLFFLYGYLLRKTHNLYMANPTNPFVICFFIIFITGFRISTDDIVLFQQQMILFFVIYLLAKITTRSDAPEARPIAPAEYKVPV